MDFQLDEIIVVIFKCVYIKFQCQLIYQRRILWIVFVLNVLCKLDSSVVFVEYVGEFLDFICLYGNNKYGYGGYCRIKEKVVK